jgi:hypothetical protein
VKLKTLIYRPVNKPAKGERRQTKTEMYAQVIYLGAISQAAAQTLSEDSTVVAFIYGRFGVAFI